MTSPSESVDLHHLPAGALVSFSLCAIGVLLAQFFRGEVHQRLEAALSPELGGSAHWRNSMVTLELCGVLLLDIASLFSITLARQGQAVEGVGVRRLLARPTALCLEWLLVSASLVVQVVLLAVYACFFELFWMLGAACRAQGSACAEGIGEELQQDFAGLDAERYCESGLGGSGAGRVFVAGFVLTVLSQGLMASSLHAEWERLSEEIHYQGDSAAQVALLGGGGGLNPTKPGGRKRISQVLRHCCAGLCCPCCRRRLADVAPLHQSTNTPVSEAALYSDDAAAPHVTGKGTVRMVLAALDYKKTQTPLTSSVDGKNMEELAGACGIQHVVAMYDEECTKENVEHAIRVAAKACQPGDCFVYYYSGHGTNVKDEDGDESDGEDEAFCFVTAEGKITSESLLIDDDFSALLCDEDHGVPKGVPVLVLTDCCHSGSICDFGRPCWKGHVAVSIAGCRDNQCSGDVGKGGVFTHSMLCAIADMAKDGFHDYSAGKLFNRTLEECKKSFNAKQDITMQCSPGHEPGHIPWPLVPQKPYEPPLSKLK